MIYAAMIWIILGLSFGLIIFEFIHVKHLTVSHEPGSLKVIDYILLKSHAKLLIGIIILWWIALLLNHVTHVDLLFKTLNPILTIVVMLLLTPLYVIGICYSKKCFKAFIDYRHHSTIEHISFTLNILTGLIYASLTNYAIQILFLI